MEGVEALNFSLTAEQQALKLSVRKFAQNELPEIALEIERDDQPPSLALKQRFGELGYLGVNLPTQYGGGGLSHLDAVLVLEEVAKVSISVAFPIFESCFGPTLAIAHFGSDQMKKTVIPKVCSGDMVVAVSMSEPEAGSALTDLKTSGRVEGDEITLNGTKRW